MKIPEKTKNVLMGLVFITIMYFCTVMMFILDGAPFHWKWYSSGYMIENIKIHQSVFVVGKWFQPKVHIMKLGNVNGKKDVVGEYFQQKVVSYIGIKINENNMTYFEEVSCKALGVIIFLLLVLLYLRVWGKIFMLVYIYIYLLMKELLW